MALTKIALLFLCILGMEIVSATTSIKPKHCADVHKPHTSGLATVYTDGDKPLKVYCQRDTDGKGAWTVFQRRFDGSLNFDRNWADYQKGFGNLSGEFWLGLDALSSLTANRRNELRIDLVRWDEKKAFATYHDFSLTNASDFYRLRFAAYVKGVPGSGEPGDSLKYHRGQRFSTFDNDHDRVRGISCARLFKSGWWFKRCLQANLNAPYFNERTGLPHARNGIIWYPFSGITFALRRVAMKLRPRAGAS